MESNCEILRFHYVPKYFAEIFANRVYLVILSPKISQLAKYSQQKEKTQLNVYVPRLPCSEKTMISLKLNFWLGRGNKTGTF